MNNIEKIYLDYGPIIRLITRLMPMCRIGSMTIRRIVSMR